MGAASVGVEVVTSEHTGAPPKSGDKKSRGGWLFAGSRDLEGNLYFFEIRQDSQSFMTLACKSLEERDSWVSTLHKLMNKS